MPKTPTIAEMASSLFGVGRTRKRRDGIRLLEVPGYMVSRMDQGISKRAVLLFGFERGKREYRRRGGGPAISTAELDAQARLLAPRWRT